MFPQMKYVESSRFLIQLPRKLSRIAALDVGTKHIGVALSDEGRMIAQPHSTIERGAGRNGSEAVSALTRKIQALIDAERVDGAYRDRKRGGQTEQEHDAAARGRRPPEMCHVTRRQLHPFGPSG